MKRGKRAIELLLLVMVAVPPTAYATMVIEHQGGSCASVQNQTIATSSSAVPYNSLPFSGGGRIQLACDVALPLFDPSLGSLLKVEVAAGSLIMKDGLTVVNPTNSPLNVSYLVEFAVTRKLRVQTFDPISLNIVSDDHSGVAHPLPYGSNYYEYSPTRTPMLPMSLSYFSADALRFAGTGTFLLYHEGFVEALFGTTDPSVFLQQTLTVSDEYYWVRYTYEAAPPAVPLPAAAWLLLSGLGGLGLMARRKTA